MKQLLDDVKVLEYGSLISAPYCGKLLADLGADVIKIEEPKEGDITRKKEPFLNDTPGSDRSGLFLYLNTNKRGVTLNINTKTGQEIFKKLAQKVDILIEDTKPGTLDKLGIGCKDLNAINPALVVSSVTPFGQTGPYKDYKGSDLIAWHMSGAGYVTPRNIGTDKQEPLRILQMADFLSGMALAVSTLCALRVQRHNGTGQQVDVSGLEAEAALFTPWTTSYWPYEHYSPSRASKATVVPYAFIQCKDGYLFTSCPEEHQWRRFVDMMGNPEWGNSPLFADRASRGQYWDSLEPLIRDWAMQYTKQEIFAMAKVKGVPIAPVSSIAEVLDTQQLKGRNFFVPVEHPETGKVTYPGLPYRIPGVEWTVRYPAPRLGQHNEEIYCGELGFSKKELSQMSAKGII